MRRYLVIAEYKSQPTPETDEVEVEARSASAALLIAGPVLRRRNPGKDRGRVEVTLLEKEPQQ